MPSAFRDQKNLGDWIEPDYFQRPRGLRRWRKALTVLTLLAVAAGVGVAVFVPGSTKLVQAGPVSAAHDMFNADCAQCHQEQFATAKKLLPGNARACAVPDAACVNCHDGPPHNALLTEESHCATCHREHRGRVSLARVPDRECTDCHGSLAEHRKGGSDKLAFKDVHGFNDDHPEFALWRNNESDPGTLRFNHKVHLALADLPADKFKVIAGPLGKLRATGCALCHEPDPAGRYMQPINYEKHCAQCHPLSIRLVGTFKGPDQERINRAVEKMNKEPAPHKAPEVVRGLLRERLLEFVQKYPVVAGEPDPATKLVPPELLGLRRTGGRAPTEVEWTWSDQKLRPALRDLMFSTAQLDNNEAVLFRNSAGCRFCHTEQAPGKKRPGEELDLLPVYQKTNITGRWLEHARFSHQRHRMLACTECHPAKTSTRTSDVLLPRLDTCQRCHTASTGAGARTDCVECHVYHRGREVYKNRTIEECLGNR